MDSAASDVGRCRIDGVDAYRWLVCRQSRGESEVVTAPASLGEFELLVLLSVMRQGRSAYAVSVRDELERSTARPVSRGAVYVTLDRLEHKGLVQSWMGEPTAARGGKAKRIFEVTPEGRTAAQASLQRAQSLAAGLGLEQG